jgi:predicted metal-dependent hydrolase
MHNLAFLDRRQQAAHPSYTHSLPHKTSFGCILGELSHKVMGTSARQNQVNCSNHRQNSVKTSGRRDFLAIETALEDLYSVMAHHHPKTMGDWLVHKDPPVDSNDRLRCGILTIRPSHRTRKRL